jgi:hypothetical protein
MSDSNPKRGGRGGRGGSVSTRASANKSTCNTLDSDEVFTKDSCGDCKDPVVEGERALECELCELWFHADCQKLSQQSYDLLLQLGTDSSNFHWFCSHCNGGAVKCLKIVSSIKQRQDDMAEELRQVSEKVSNLEQNLEGRVELEISKHTANMGKQLATDISKDLDSKIRGMVQESVQQDKRKLNVIIRNFPESPEDTKSVEELVRDKLKVNAQISGVERIGNKPAQGDKPRMTRVTVKEISSKWEILRKAKLLASDMDPSIRSTYIGADLTREQRSREYELRTELKRRRGLGEDLVISKGVIVPRGVKN